MTNAEILEFVKQNPVFYLATSDNNIPHVRAMMVCKADENGIIFNTKSFKDSYKELEDNPNVEMCFCNSKKDIQIRIFGKVKLINSIELKKEIVEKFPILQSLVNENGYDVIIPYCLKNWEAKVWDRSKKYYSKDII